MVAEHDWEVGGMASSNTNTAKQYYATELGNSDGNIITYRAKIGLMYVSDYGYAASPENWNTTLYNYDNDTNRNNNWMYMGWYDWTISRRSDYTSSAFNVFSTGRVSDSSAYGSNGPGVRPSFYLESSVELSGGNGTSTDPYRLSIA